MGQKVIIVEGIDGSGKTTLANRLAGILEAPVIRFPHPDLKPELAKYHKSDLNTKSRILERLKKDFIRMKHEFLPQTPVIILERSPISTVVYNATSYIPESFLRQEFYPFIFSLARKREVSILFCFKRFRPNDDIFDEAFLKEVNVKYRIEYVYWLFRAGVKTYGLFSDKDYENTIKAGERLRERIKL